MQLNLICLVLLCGPIVSISAKSLTEYFHSFGQYFGYEYEGQTKELQGFEQRIPYEVSETDEKFIAHAIELTGVVPSELDACQHRLILKLQQDCHTMNDIAIAKLAVGLLNCQSYIEGRKIYPCTDQMTLKQCTSEMDSDVWTSYHLMTNRAKAVCYSVRQAQFRGVTEHTINRLMDAARDQLNSLDKIAVDQKEIQKVSQTTLNSVMDGNKGIMQQQEDLRKAQLAAQFSLEDNINKLATEKVLILETQKELSEMTKNVQEKINRASDQLDKQAESSHDNHKELLTDLLAIQEKAQTIFQKIDESSNLLMKQSELAAEQYEMTLKQLKEMNSTVHSLINLVGGTKHALEERLSWITAALGDTDDAIDKLSVILWHMVLLLVAMISCAFLGMNTAARVAVITFIPANLALTIFKLDQAVNAPTLCLLLTTYLIAQTVALSIWKLLKTDDQLQICKKEDGKILSRPSTPLNLTPENSVLNAEISRITGEEESSSTPKFSRLHMDYLSPTPPLSRNFSRSKSRTPFQGDKRCLAKTKMGAQCKLSASYGNDYCTRHQKGDSIIS